MDLGSVLFVFAIIVSFVAGRPPINRYAYEDNYSDGGGNFGHDPPPRLVERVSYVPGYRGGKGYYQRERILRNTGPPRPLRYRVDRKGPNRVRLCPKNSKCKDQLYDVNQYNVRQNY
ncbi:uncharacterized protein LOC110855099 [Folsomia candida]|uniref:Octanoyltransferase n=1 Tax=Folsomia candida TaxID=158441 RepID=A0A226DVZ9_FOLCA|nr:uncharacterized protein LOC110855099 [Folsomia candida]OXA48887.1 Octanoyltransferase [Folsomia candida]